MSGVRSASTGTRGDAAAMTAVELSALADKLLEPQAPSSAAKIVNGGLLKRNRRTKIPVGDEHNLPLHAKAVPCLDLAHVLSLAAPDAKLRMQQLLQGISTDRMSPTAPRPGMTIPASHLDRLLSAGVLSPYTGSSGTTLNYFTVVELEKRRLRPIMWPEAFLKSSNYKAQITLPRLQDYDALQGSVAAAFDLAASYWQIPLPDDVNFVLFDSDGKQWRMDRLPFGLDMAAELMQTVLETPARQPRRPVLHTEHCSSARRCWGV